VGGHLVTDFSTKVPFYWIGLALAAITIGVNWWVQHSKHGYYLQAIREDQDAAHSLGIPLTRYKNYALAISAFFTAFAGALYGLNVGFVDTAVQSVEVSVQIVLICIIGGIGTIPGPVVGALVLVPLSEALRSNLIAEGLFKLGVDETSRTGLFLKENLAHAHLLIYGLLVVVVILFMPDGVVGFFRALAGKRAARAARAAAAGGEAP
jgi:branched-chain amino acid transport system permease protein